MLKRFLRDTGGNYAMITALMMGPLVGGVALAVDLAEMSRQRTKVLQTLDATNLATARYMLAGIDVDTSKPEAQREAEREAKIKAYAQTYFNATLPSVDPANVALSTIVPQRDSQDGLRSVAVLTYRPYFRPVAMALNGMSGDAEIKLPQEAEVSLENTVELALVLDNSGSMDFLGKDTSQKRIVLLRKAAKQLVDRLSQRGSMMRQVDEPVRISLVPFAGAVNVGPDNEDAAWMDTQGRSPVHHENFGWGSKTTIGTNKTIELENGLYKKKGAGWPTAEQNQTVTRFTMFDELKVYRNGSSGATRPFTSWQGCVESRPYPMNVDDTPASTGNPASLFVPMFAPDEAGARVGPDTRQQSNMNLNSWWPDDGGSGATLQANMKKYFNVQSSSVGTLGFNVYGAYSNYRGPNYSCTTTPILPLTDVSDSTRKAELVAAIDAMQPLGATNVPEGMAWGWRTLSSAAPFTEGRPERVERNLKVIVVLTDGANTYYTPSYLGGSDTAGNRSYYSAYGYAGKAYQAGDTRIFKGTSVQKTHTERNYTAAINAHFATLCDNAKAADVIVMTVALDLDDKTGTVQTNPDKAQIEALKSCASESRYRADANGNPEKLFWNSTGKTLEDDFRKIADELSNLRITM